MALISHRDALRPTPSGVSSLHESDGEAFELCDFEEELKRLSIENEQLMADLHAQEHEADPSVNALPPLCEAEALDMLRMENSELKARVEELEALLQSSSGQSEDVWLDRQREYEMLLEEKSEVIRSLHQKMQAMQENSVPGERPLFSSGTGQAEEIFRLKKEMEEQRSQLQQDEDDMMTQLRQMELMMAKERAEMARQRQEMNRLQTDLAREIEMASRDPGLRERLQHLRRAQEVAKPTPAPLLTPLASSQTAPSASNSEAKGKNTSGLFRRIFG